MNGLLKVIRFLLSTVFLLLLMIILLLSPIIISLFLTLRSPDHIKEWIADSGIYTDFVDIALDETIARTTEGAVSQGFPLEEEELRNTAKEVLEPTWLQSTAESILDGIYVWLNGDSEYPLFTIDLADRKESVSNALRKLLHAKVDALETCTEPMEVEKEFNPVEAECIPAGVSRAEVDIEVDRWMDQLINNENFLKESKFEGKNLELPLEFKENAPEVFSQIKLGVSILIALILLMPALTILIALNRGIASILVSIIFLLSGAVNLTISLSAQRIVDYLYTLLRPELESSVKESEAIGDLLLTFVSDAVGSISGYLLYFSIGFIIAGLIMIIATIVVKKLTSNGNNTPKNQ